MCFIQGSIEQATSPCSMCKVFKPSGARCPHHKDICRKRANHPHCDVVFFRNAEVQSFNECGYCKYARLNPSVKSSSAHNPGWPGCCRPPTPDEYKLIQAVEWRAVSTIWNVPIPPEIKSLLDSVSPSRSPFPPAALPLSPPIRSSGSPPNVPPVERKNSASRSPSTKTGSPSSKTAPMPIPGKSRSSGSPKQISSGLTSSFSRATGANASPKATATAIEREGHRHSDKHGDSSPTQVEDGSISRRGHSRRSTISAPPPSFVVTKVPPEEQTSASVRRRTSNSDKSSSSTSSSQTASLATRTPQSRRGTLENVFTNLKISPSSTASKSPNSASSESSGGSLSESTVTSEGFTDYLSDESEQELQRQAEQKAAVQAQNHAEEIEFKVARQQLAHVDLRPPKSWNPGNAGGGGGSASRPQAQAAAGEGPYPGGSPYSSTQSSRTQVDVSYGRAI